MITDVDECFNDGGALSPGHATGFGLSEMAAIIGSIFGTPATDAFRMQRLKRSEVDPGSWTVS